MPIVAPGSGGGTSSLTVAEVDGAPSVTTTTLIVSNGSLTDSGGGTATVVTGAGGSANFQGAKAYATAAQTISHNTFTALTFDSEFYDTNSYHAAGSARFTIPASGYYAFGAQASWVSNATGQRFIGISYNGGTTNADYIVRSSIGGSVASGANPRHVSCHGQAYMTAAAYIEAHVYQSSGANLDVGGTASTGGTSSFWIAWLGA